MPVIKNTAEQARMMRREIALRWGVLEYPIPKRCKLCGAKSLQRRPDGVCRGCVQAKGKR